MEAIEPVVIEESDTLFDSSKPGRLEAVVVLCGKSAAAPPPGGLSGLPGGSEAGEEALDWLQRQERELRGIAAQRALDRGVPVGDPPEVRLVREPNDGAGQRRLAELTKAGLDLDVRRDGPDDGGARRWAALFTRYTPPPQARLGGIVKRAHLAFAPRMTAHGSVELHATSRIEILPSEAPRGAGAETCAGELARARRVAATEAGWLRARLNLLRLRLPPEAATAFANGQSFPLERTAPLWGRERTILLRLTGKATPVVDVPLARAARVTAADWRQRLAGEWRLTIEHERYGRIDGWMVLDPREPVLEAGLGYPINADLLLLPIAGVMEQIRPHGGPDRQWAFEDGALVLQVHGPYGRLELVPALDGSSLVGTWAVREQFARVFHRATCERTRPAIDEVVGVRTQGRDEPARVLERIQEKEAGVSLLLTGTDLPRAGTDGFGVRGFSHAHHRPAFQFDDPAVTVERWLGAPSGDRLLLDLRVRKGFLTGPRRLQVDGASIDVDLNALLGQAEWSPFMEEPALQRHGILDPVDGDTLSHERASLEAEGERGIAKFRLAAEYSTRPASDTLQGKVWIERHGAVVRRLPPEHTVLRRSPWQERQESTYLGSVFLDGTAADGTQPTNAPGWRLTEGDVVAFEIEGRVARLVPRLRAPDPGAPLLAPFLEDFRLFDPENPDAREKTWTEPADEVAQLARYASPPESTEQPVALHIRRGRDTVYRFPAENTSVLREADGPESGRVYRRVVRLGPLTKQPAMDASGQTTPGYVARDGDVLVATIGGGQKELVLRVPETLVAEPRIEPLPLRSYTEIVAIEVLRAPGAVPPGLVREPAPPDRDRWLLFALVRNVNRAQLGPYRLRSPDARAAYRELCHVRDLAEARKDPGSLAHEGYGLALDGVGLDRALGMARLPGIVIVAETPRGSLPGFRSLIVEDAERQWLLDPGTVDGELRVVRDVTPQFGGYEAVREAFVHDRLFVELRLRQEIAPDVIGVSILGNGKPWTFGGRPAVPARRVAGDRKLYRTGPIHLLFAAQPEPPPGDDVHWHVVKPGDVLVATPAERLFEVPPAHRIQVYGTPGDVRFPDFGDASWRHALAVASAVRREHGIEETGFGLEGHAAMLALRWQFLQMAVEQRREIGLILANPQLVLGYHDVLAPALAAVWSRPESESNPLASLAVEVPGGGTLPLVDALNPAWIQREFRVLGAPPSTLALRIEERDTWLAKAMRRTLEQQVEWIDEAMRTAREIKDHDLEALANLTGHAFQPVVETLRARLLKPVDHRSPDGRTWRTLEPDVAARLAVNQVNAQLFVLVSEKRATRKRVEAAVALTTVVAMSPYGLLARVALARVAALAAAGGADLGLAIVNVAEWHAHEAELQFARNAAPLLGWNRFDLDLASKQPYWIPYCRLAMSLLFCRFDVKDLARTLQLTRALPIADDVAEALLVTGAQGMRQLSPAEVRAFLLAVEDARLLQATGGELSAAHRRVLRATKHLETQQNLLRLQFGSVDAALARAAAETALDPTAVETAGRSAQAAIARLTTKGLDELAFLTPVESEALRIVFVDARLASGSGRALSASQRAALECESDLLAEAARRGIDLANAPVLASRSLDLLGDSSGLPLARASSSGGKAPQFPPPALPPGVELGTYRGGGAFASVYNLLGQGLPTGRVIKIIRTPQVDVDHTPLPQILERMERCARMLAEHPEIPQLACRSFRMHGGFGFVVQDVLPDGAKLVQELSLNEIDGACEAMVALHKQIADARMAWLDGHFGNAYFFRDASGKLRAGVLDPDMLVREGAAVGNDMLAGRVLCLERGGGFCGVNSVDDPLLTGTPRTQLERFEQLIFMDATEVAPMTFTAERMTLAFLEARGFIRFERASAEQIRRSGGAVRGRFVDGAIRLSVVEGCFGDLQRHATYGDRVLRQSFLVPARRSWPLPFTVPHLGMRAAGGPVRRAA